MNPSDTETLDIGVPTWKFVWGAIRFRPWQFLFNNLAVLVRVISALMLGLIVQQFFNLLTNQAAAAFNLTTLIAFLVVRALCRMGGFWGVVRMNRPFIFHTHTLWDVAYREGVNGACSRLAPDGVTQLRCQIRGYTFFSSIWLDQ